MIYSYKKSDGKTWYYIKYNTNGKSYTKRGFKSRNEAASYYSEFKDKIDSENYLTHKTYQQIYDMYMKLYSQKVKESTLIKTKTVFEKHILPVFGKIKIKDITSVQAQEFGLSLSNFALGKQIFVRAKKIMDYAETLEIIPKNPFEKVQMPKFKKMKKHEDFLEVKDINSLLNVIEDFKSFCMFRTLIYTGLRRGELLALTWDDIDFQNKTLQVNKTLAHGENYKIIVNSTKTESSKRTINIDDQTIMFLKKLKLQTKNNLVFPNKSGTYQRLGNIQDKLNRYCKLANIKKIRVHDLRHTHASLLFASGATAKEVQERLGHSRIETTLNIYTHLNKKQKMLTLENFIGYMDSEAK
ncbi:tyrosine-type recombinase/integrase [Helcococcus bovis]|uniref:tyrosine-type recombinase/integrase n=1 Tax=Helcococcus bovis TaxID=3153252 RepID=UPI0038B990F8